MLGPDVKALLSARSHLNVDGSMIPDMTAVTSFTKKSLVEARMRLTFVKLHSCAKVKKLTCGTAHQSMISPIEFLSPRRI